MLPVERKVYRFPENGKRVFFIEPALPLVDSESIPYIKEALLHLSTKVAHKQTLECLLAKTSPIVKQAHLFKFMNLFFWIGISAGKKSFEIQKLRLPRLTSFLLYCFQSRFTETPFVCLFLFKKRVTKSSDHFDDQDHLQ
ncbi:MAG: hypothetical protein A3F09_01350 [Chlamydiae bacterium RIFCSPHIGHO2_12_FULL_49_11]|nr:MAG: hypothetical protein A3F09_01350 [Chlamydiae bacterium RIFCSPHIGHO2_12_FULL_49_11]